MHIDKIIEEIKINYPGKKIYIDDEENPSEVICEIESVEINPQRSVYIAVIDRKVEHLHRESKETIEVLRGSLIVTVDGRSHTLGAGRFFKIKPGQIHFTEGHDTWIKITSEPGWKPEHHRLLEN